MKYRVKTQEAFERLQGLKEKFGREIPKNFFALVGRAIDESPLSEKTKEDITFYWTRPASFDNGKGGFPFVLDASEDLPTDWLSVFEAAGWKLQQHELHIQGGRDYDSYLPETLDTTIIKFWRLTSPGEYVSRGNGRGETCYNYISAAGISDGRLQSYAGKDMVLGFSVRKIQEALAKMPIAK